MGCNVKLYNTVLYKDLKKRVSPADWPVVRKALHDTVRELGVYSESNSRGVILTADVNGAFLWNSSPQGLDFWLDVALGQPVRR